MANTIRIMRSVSNVAPTGLAQGELAYVEASGTGDGRLYIGAAGATVEVVGGQYFIDLLNSYDADLGSFTLPASTTISAYGASLIDDADAATARATLDVDQSGVDNSTDVTMSGTPNYITLSGQDIVRGLIDLAADVTGDLPFANIAQIATASFVGRTTASTGDMEVLTATQATALLNVATIALKGLLPVLSNVSSEFLDGTGSWSTPAGGGNISDTDTSTAGWSFVLDEDAMGSDSDTKLATQQSIKAYVDGAVSGALTHKGGYNAATDTPALDTGSPTLVIGDMYTVTAAGTFFTEVLEVGDVLISDVDSTDAAALSDWTIVQNNIGAASETEAGYIEIATQAEMNTATDDLRAVTPLKFASSTLDGGTF